MVETERIEQEYGRKALFLAAVAMRRTTVIVAERQLAEAVQEAKRAGCTGDEIAGAVRMLERAASQ